MQPPSKVPRGKIRNVNLEHKENLTLLERFAVWITNHIGSMGFFILLLVWTIGWLTWNMYAPAEYRFDAYPSFVMWLFISNLIQLFVMPLIMVGQNLDSRHSEARAEADFELSVKSEKDIEVVLAHLEYQNDLMLQILRRVEAQENK